MIGRLAERLAAAEGRAALCEANLNNLREITIDGIEGALTTLSTRTASMQAEVKDLGERLTLLEEAVEDMEAEDDTQIAPPPPTETNEITQ